MSLTFKMKPLFESKRFLRENLLQGRAAFTKKLTLESNENAVGTLGE